ncbi:MAG: class I SAM-dependent methyltransferase [Candidatus Cloacimonetes bacterium]|nr:class I SAM-dependent methyltransferase [Candidatus Cloacimonadota bacterium]
MAIPIITNWKNYFTDENEGLGSSYERVIINQLLERVCDQYSIQKVLEAPLFGFTGLSGINSMNLALKGKEVALIDSNSERLVMVETIWQERKLPVDIKYSQDFSILPYDDAEFDLCWNFSALWFVKDLSSFLAEFNRLAKKVILLIVPNRSGLGFIFQSLSSSRGYKDIVNTKWIRPACFSKILLDLGWKEVEHGLIDCPPWPDIGMKKEVLAKKLFLSFLLDRHTEQQHQNSIMDYYRGDDDQFPEKMMKYNRLEKKLPNLLKRFWSHHHYYLYVKKGR